MTRQFKITPVTVEGFPHADGVIVNKHGEWLGETDYAGEDRIVSHYSDEDGDYIPAPSNWRDLIIEEL